MHAFCVKRITSCGACSLSKIDGPLNCISTAKDSVTSRDKNKKKHKTVFGDVKGVRIHERTKVPAWQLIRRQSNNILNISLFPLYNVVVCIDSLPKFYVMINIVFGRGGTVFAISIIYIFNNCFPTIEKLHAFYKTPQILFP